MSKDKKSKLDPHAERLDHWFTPEDKGGQGLTLDQAREQLLSDGVSVSCSALSVWWSNRQSEKQREALLGQIASGARACREVETELRKHPAPEMETLIALHRVLILKLSTEGNAEPEMLELVNRMMKPVVQFARLKQLEGQLALDRDKFQFDAAKACLARLPELKIISTSKVSETEKVEQIRLKLFGVTA